MIKITLCLFRLTGAVLGFPFPTSNEVLNQLDEISTKFIGEDHGEEEDRRPNRRDGVHVARAAHRLLEAWLGHDAPAGSTGSGWYGRCARVARAVRGAGQRAWRCG